MPIPTRWTIYALGGGMGHLTRALSLARQAARRGAEVRVISNSRFAPILAERRFDQLLKLESSIEVIVLPSDGEKTAVVAAVDRELRTSTAPDVLVVDTFPRGLAGELGPILDSSPAYKVLIHRDLNRNYARCANLDAFAARYDLVLVPGEDAPLAALPQARRTAPWLLCDADELLPRKAARAAFGLLPTEHLPLVAVIGTGMAAEALAMAHLAGDLSRDLTGQTAVRFISCDAPALAAAGELGRSLWPFLTVLPGVDLLVGAGGYNTVNEARATSTPLIAIAEPRLYDRQARRLRSSERARNRQHLFEMVRQRMLSATSCRSDRQPAFSNGASVAQQLIERGVRCGAHRHSARAGPTLR